MHCFACGAVQADRRTEETTHGRGEKRRASTTYRIACASPSLDLTPSLLFPTGRVLLGSGVLDGLSKLICSTRNFVRMGIGAYSGNKQTNDGAALTQQRRQEKNSAHRLRITLDRLTHCKRHDHSTIQKTSEKAKNPGPCIN